jgi:hypothetical protein
LRPQAGVTNVTDPSDIGPVVFQFQIQPGGQTVNCFVYLNTYLSDAVTLPASTTPYQLAVQQDIYYACGPITTQVLPPAQLSTIHGAIHYLANGTDQFYQGLLYYWNATSS